MAAVASLPGLRVGLSECSQSSQCAFSNNSFSPLSLGSNSACVFRSYRSTALHAGARASPMEARASPMAASASAMGANAGGTATEGSETEKEAWRKAAIAKANEIKARVARQKSLHEAETELRFLESQLQVSVPVGLVTAAGFGVRYMVAGMPASVQSPHADFTFFIVLFFAIMYARPFFQYPVAKNNWSKLNKAVENDLQRAAQELD